MVEKTRVIKVFESFILGRCKSCNKEISIRVGDYLKRFCNGHNMRGKNRPKDFIGGRYYDKKNKYWYVYAPDYFSSNTKGCVREHVYFYQEKYKLCMLKWGVVHHKDKNTDNNMPWNLQGMMWGKHSKLHSIKDKSGRRCLLCGKKTYIDKHGYECWTAYKDGHICSNCRSTLYRKKKKLELSSL